MTLNASANGYSFRFNGVNFGLSTYNCWVIDFEWPVLPDPKIGVYELGGASGAVTQGSQWKQSYLALDCVIVGESYADCKTKVDAFAAELKSIHETEHEAILTVDCVPGFSETARYTKGITIKRKGAAAVFTLYFVIPQPV